jgi:hypothetical protein
MTPTNELRFAEREVPAHMDGTNVVTKTVRVLQQKWALYWSDDMGGMERDSEWRDVPLVKEE